MLDILPSAGFSPDEAVQLLQAITPLVTVTRIVRVIAMFITALVGVGLTASPAAAKPSPLHEVFFDDPGFALPDIDCGTFTIRETSFDDRIDVITYFDDAGDPVRVHLHVSFQGTLTNLSTGRDTARQGVLQPGLRPCRGHAHDHGRLVPLHRAS